MQKNRFTIIFLIALSLYSIFSFSVMKNFGITYDEPTQQTIGHIMSDYVDGTSKSFDALKDDVIYYGPFFETLNYNFGNTMEKSFHMDQVDAFHVLIILVSILGIFFFFKLVSEMFDKKTSLIASAFLMLQPVIFAHSQYNSKDIPLLSFFITSLYFLYTGFKDRKIWRVVFGGIFCGLMLDIRIDGLLLLPVFFGAYALYLIFKLRNKPREESFNLIKKDCFFIFIFLTFASATVYIFWPTLWHNPLFFFKALNYFLHHGWAGNVLYFGKFYPATHLPWHYAPFFLAVTAPVAILILAIIGIIVAFKKILRGEKFFEITLIFLWLFLRLGLGVMPESVKYDGIRQFLIIIPAFIVFAALGFDFVLKKIPKYFPKIKKWKTQVGIIFIVFFWILFEFFKIFPFGGSYFNEAVRFTFSKNLDKQFDFEYWGPSYRQGVEWLDQNAEPNSTYCVPIAGNLIEFYPVREDLEVDCSENTDYLMFFTRWAGIPDNVEKTYHYKEKDPVYRISRYNSDLLVIYKIN